MTTEPARRFYQHAEAVAAEGGCAILLDRHTLKTPAGHPFRVPTHALAEAIAAEWNAQGEKIDPFAMPLTRLANVALDRTPKARADLVREIAKYGETDLLCHRADAPAKLVARQSESWDPLLAWARAELGFAPAVVAGIAAQENDCARLAAAAEALDDFRLTALAHATSLAGSAIVGFALLKGRLDAAAAYTTAQLDDEFQLEAWGEDSEARIRLDRLRGEFESTHRFLRALA